MRPVLHWASRTDSFYKQKKRQGSVAPQFLQTLETVTSKVGNICFVFKKDRLLCNIAFGLFSTSEDIYTFLKAGMLLHCLFFLQIRPNWALNCIIKVSVAYPWTGKSDDKQEKWVQMSLSYSATLMFQTFATDQWVVLPLQGKSP